MTDFLLKLPSSALRKVSYAWFGVVVFYPWQPLLAAVLAATLLASLLLLTAQHWAWQEQIIKESDKKVYIDRPRLPFTIQARNLALALLVSGVIAYLFGGQLTLSGSQWFLILAGFFVLQTDLKIFGMPVVYIVAGHGLAIRFADARLLLRYSEIRRLRYLPEIDEVMAYWSALAPKKSPGAGLLLIPRDREGFTRLIDHILITPTTPAAFRDSLPSNLKNSWN